MWDAAKTGDLETLRRELDGGADANAVMINGVTPLHAASLSGQLDAVRLLLDRRADAARADVTGDSALHAAMRGKHLYESGDWRGVVRLLLERNAPIHARNAWGLTPLDDAIYYGADFWILEELFLHGASLERALAVGKGRTRSFLQGLAQRRPRCLAAAQALFRLRLPRDMRRLLARLVWSTRRDAVWDSAVGRKTMRVN
jgi:hypothetical protein